MHSLSYIKKPYLSHANAYVCEVRGVHANDDDDLVLFHAYAHVNVCHGLSSSCVLHVCAALSWLGDPWHLPKLTFQYISDDVISI